MPITSCPRCSKLYIERSEETANEPGRLCQTCLKGGTAAHGLAALCEPIVNGYAAGKSGLDSDMLQHLIDLGDRAEAVQRLEAAALALVRRLEALASATSTPRFPVPTPSTRSTTTFPRCAKPSRREQHRAGRFPGSYLGD